MSTLTPSNPAPHELFAALDMGSNSFHMVIARLVDGQLVIIDRLREPVRLAAGLDARKQLDEPTQELALKSLARMGQRLRDTPASHVRAVGTDTLRRARNSRAFLEQAQAALGHAIEVVPGREEARLIYLGVAHGLPDQLGRRLVVDIGGGSTECILGEGYEAQHTDSLSMGCVSWSRRFFEDGVIDRERFRKAEITAARELQTMARTYNGLGWESCLGASGTIHACAAILRANGWSESGIDGEGLKRLRRELIDCGRTQKLELAGMPMERGPVLPGGVAILRALFEGLEIEHMAVSDSALREGLLYDMLGRIRHEDVRDQTIRRMVERFHVDLEQASRVERTALGLYRQAAAAWNLSPESWRQWLVWAARLHEIGLAISYSGFHKHGAYLIENSDMPGFSREDKLALAALVRMERRKLSAELRKLMPALEDERLLCLGLLLRLSVLLNRSRSPRALPASELTVHERNLELRFPLAWLEAHPLTGADLEDEALTLRGLGFKLLVS